VLGGLIGLALVCGFALLLLRRIGQNRKATANEEGPLMYEGKAGAYPSIERPPVELHGGTPLELEASKQPHGTTTELQGSTPGEWR
jgi:hypothetical protein